MSSLWCASAAVSTPTAAASASPAASADPASSATTATIVSPSAVLITPTPTTTPNPTPTTPEVTPPPTTPAQAAAAAAAPPSPSTPFVFTPHTAEYTIGLDASGLENSQTDIRDVKGKLEVELIDAGDSYIYNQTSNAQIYFKDDEMDQVIVQVTTCQAKDGSEYNYSVRILTNGQEDTFHGRATSPKNLIGTAVLKTDQDDHEDVNARRFDLPIGAFFPLAHLKHVMEAIARGETKLNGCVVFDAASQAQTPVQVNAAMSTNENPKVTLNNKPDLLKADKVYNISFAIFTPGTPDEYPESSIIEEVLPSGIPLRIHNKTKNGVPTVLTLTHVNVK